MYGGLDWANKYINRVMSTKVLETYKSTKYQGPRGGLTLGSGYCIE